MNFSDQQLTSGAPQVAETNSTDAVEHLASGAKGQWFESTRAYQPLVENKGKTTARDGGLSFAQSAVLATSDTQLTSRRPRKQTFRKQNHGSLELRGPASSRIWYARFYASVPTEKGTQRKQVREMLGYASRMTQEQAREELHRRVEAHNRSTPAKHAFLAESVYRMESEYSGSSHTVGAFCELMVCADLLRRGFEVFKAVNHFASADLVALCGGRFITVEVKSATDDRRLQNYRTKRQQGRYDVLATVTKTGIVSYYDSSLKPLLLDAPTEATA